MSSIFERNLESSPATTDLTQLPSWLPDRNRSYVIFGFTGQGQQYPEMLEDWYDYSSDSNQILRHFHSETGTAYGKPLPASKLEKGPLMQPANVTLAVLGTTALKQAGIIPNEAFGHSLGEYGAVHAAGFIDAEYIISLARRRGEATSYAIKKLEDLKIETGMAAFSTGNGNAEEILREYIQTEGIAREDTDLVNINTEGQAVVSGIRTTIERLVRGLGDRVKGVILDVDGAYHHHTHMKPAARALQPFVDATPIMQPSGVKLYSPTTLSELKTRNDVAGMFPKQLVSQVKWRELIRSRLDYLNHPSILRLFERNGAEEVLFVEIGAYPPDKPNTAGVLIGSTKRNVKAHKENKMPVRHVRVSQPKDLQ